MKKTSLNIAFVALVALGITSCKDGAKESKTSEVKETLTATLAATPYTIQTEKATISWLGSKPVGTHTGTINVQDGAFYLQGTTIESGKFVIDMSSITVTDLDENSGKESLESHLKGTVEGKEGDFFNVTKYPTATFEVTGVTDMDGKTIMSGNLTMLDTTQNISFPVLITNQNNMVQVKSETFTIDRTKWGINYGSKSIFDNLGDKFIADDMEITIDVTAMM
ncbi:MAG: polyisoprenoid-binding protein YceI [Saprospiraceae bacterium]|jgi:polyisoprenoid-binding protein YceI